MKTQEQIDQEIAALKTLKPTVRRCNAFGDDHHAAIDAQIEVLEKKLSHDAVYDRYEPTGDDDIDGDEGRSESIMTAASDAHRWMHDESDDAPSEDWGTLAQ